MYSDARVSRINTKILLQQLLNYYINKTDSSVFLWKKPLLYYSKYPKFPTADHYRTFVGTDFPS